MHHDYCRQVDQDMLVEAYIAGKLRGEALKKFEEHLRHCEKHTQAVSLEKALKKGITEFARSEMKVKIQKRLQKQHETRFLLLRYAAILLVAVITPLLIYYQYNVTPHVPPVSYYTEEEQTNREEPGPAEKERISEEKKMSPKPAGQPAEKKVPQYKPTVPDKSRITAVKEEVNTPPSPPPKTVLDTEPAAGAGQDIEGLTAAVSARRDQTAGAVPGKTMMEPVSISKYPGAAESKKALEKELEKKVLSDSTRIHTCLHQELSREQMSTFQMTVRLDIDDSGMVKVLEIVDAGHSSQAVQDCLVDIVNHWMVTQGNKQQINFKIRYTQISAGS
jgi:hypothetical protein